MQLILSPGIAQPENVIELEDKPIWNAPQNLYGAGRGFFSTGCNRFTKLPKSFMRPLPQSNENSTGSSYSLTPALALITGIPTWSCSVYAQA